MKEQSRHGCVVWGGFVFALLFLLLLSAGGWWFFGLTANTAEAPPPITVFVFLLSPASGDEVEVGDYVPVTLQAVGLNTLLNAEVFVNGVSLGEEKNSLENASWVWQPLSVGIHSLTARVTDVNGEIGQSQTVLVNVLEGDGLLQISALDGQALEEVGADFGVPLAQMAGANPNFAPGQPLPVGALVQVPIGDGVAGNGPGQGGEGLSIPLIFWEFTPQTPVDKSYCYTSGGDGNWVKMPKKPFDFFSGSPLKYIQQDGIPKGGAGVIKVQCWGWLGGTLKFLGEGETKFDVFQPADKLVILGQGFELTGKPQVPLSGSPPETGGGNTKTIPPPFAMREPADTADCTKHYGNILAGFVCDALLNASVKQYRVLQWEWEPRVGWSGDDVWLNEIDGYRIYEIDPFTKTPKLLSEVKNPKQKAAAVPLPWGAPCYGVQAYIDDPVLEPSEIAEYCPGQPTAAQKITLDPINWLTTGGEWIQDGDCDTYGTGDSYLIANSNLGFGNKPGEVLVGSYIVDDDENDCFAQGDYAGAVKFSNSILLNDAVIHKAVLKFAASFTYYSASGVATNYKLLCVGGVGKAKQDWTGLGGANHFVGKNILSSYAYYNPISSLSGWNHTPEVDVTSVVSSWMKNPQSNHGFILRHLNAPHPATDGAGSCSSRLAYVQLEIHYFVP